MICYRSFPNWKICSTKAISFKKRVKISSLVFQILI